MLDPKNIEQLQLVLAFIVPGLIIMYIRSRFIYGRPPSHRDNILSYIVLSTLYYALIIPFIGEALAKRESWTAWAAAWIGLILIGPYILGVILGVATQKEWFAWVTNKLELTLVHVIPAAWDWRFSTIPRSGMFVMITLSNDEKVAGFFGSNSFASSDAGDREEEYSVTDEGWKPRDEKVGILIPLSMIKYVEFWEPKL
jgi:hypothetical protein